MLDFICECDFVGAVCYADDLALLAPSGSAAHAFSV